MRHFLSEELSHLSGIDVIGTAPDAYVARNKILRLEPDVVTLDINMPKIDGLTFLKKIMKYHPVPVIIFSSYTKKGAEVTLNALEAGAVDYMEKPSSFKDKNKTIRLIGEKIRQASRANPTSVIARNEVTKQSQGTALASVSPAMTTKGDEETLFNYGSAVIAVGASTGGTVAIKEILTRLPADLPPIVIVQHMPPDFTRAFAERLDSICDINVKEAVSGDHLYPGTALVAPGDCHMELRKNNNGYYVSLNRGELINNQRPSVEVLFDSVAKTAGGDAIGVILTGMGNDGAKGLLEMKKAGAYTVAQDENSCVVFGMPKQAIKLGAAAKVASMQEIPAILINHSRS
jgi:two-component system chemotaxis response regulator CheB